MLIIFQKLCMGAMGEKESFQLRAIKEGLLKEVSFEEEREGRTTVLECLLWVRNTLGAFTSVISLSPRNRLTGQTLISLCTAKETGAQRGRQLIASGARLRSQVFLSLQHSPFPRFTWKGLKK